MRLRPACQATIQARLPQPTSDRRNDLVNADVPAHGGHGCRCDPPSTGHKVHLVLQTLADARPCGRMGLSLIALFRDRFGALYGTCRNYQRRHGALAEVAGPVTAVSSDYYRGSLPA